MKKISNLEHTRTMNGGSAAVIIAGLAIAAPYAEIAWKIGEGLGSIIARRLFKR